MASNSETGHAINVANFSSLISFVDAYGTAYNPSKPSIALSALSNQVETAKVVLENVNSAMAANSNAIAAREVSFNPISKLITRVFNFIKASDTLLVLICSISCGANADLQSASFNEVISSPY